MRSRFAPLVLTAGVALLATTGARAQQLSRFERDRGVLMLETLRDDIRKDYFDPAYAGVDLDGVVEAARKRVQAAGTLEEVLATLAQVTLQLNDSHTLFLPPGMVYRPDYGWEMRFVGDTCRVWTVKEDSDARTKGLAGISRTAEQAGRLVWDQ
jgi:hypothetical protein